MALPKEKSMISTLRAVGRAALVTILAALMPMGLSGGKRTGLELGLQSAVAASKALAASRGGPLILSLSDNPGPGESPGPPVYAGIALFFMNTDGEWVAIEFVRQPTCIPQYFNLLEFFDLPGAFACPLTFAGEEWWHAEDLIGLDPWETLPPFPFQAHYVGAGAIPIYFVKLAELTAAMADGVLTIGELDALPSLLVGRTSKYQMIQLNPEQGHRPGHSTTVAYGALQDGRSFQYHKVDRNNETISIEISFD
jgi:hypothetical protein